MKRLRIPPIAIAAIGAVLCLLAVGLIFGLKIKPTQDEIAAQKARYDAAFPDSTPGAKLTAQKQVAAAVLQVNQTKYQWSLIEARLMPRYNVSLPRLTSWQQLSNELTYNLGPDIEHYIPGTGVVPLTSVSISPPPTSPNAITNAPLIIPIGGSASSGGSSGGGGGYPGGGGGSSYSGGGGGAAGSITVGGDFRRLLYHFLKWNDFNRLVLADNLSLHGNSPYMTASYNAEVIIFPQGDDKLAKPIVAAGGGAAGSAGAGPSGYPGGGSSGRSTGYPGGG